MTVASTRLTSADLEGLPDDGKRYEIIDGELYVTCQPTWAHQGVCDNLVMILGGWSSSTGLGSVRSRAGVTFADDDDVAPDIVWISKERLRETLQEDGYLHAAPEVVAEVISPGARNERRDRDVKLKLYSRRGVQEYWIVDARRRSIDVFRRQGTALVLTARLSPYAWLAGAGGEGLRRSLARGEKTVVTSFGLL